VRRLPPTRRAARALKRCVPLAAAAGSSPLSWAAPPRCDKEIAAATKDRDYRLRDVTDLHTELESLNARKGKLTETKAELEEAAASPNAFHPHRETRLFMLRETEL